jgi:uncharacterized OsmC-like protein
METVRTTYLGGYRTQATHMLSSQQIITDAPLDNNGKGEAFSPTDLVSAALTSCMITLMDITANGKGFSLGDLAAKTTKIMAANPRRISQVIIEFDLSAKQYTERERVILEQSAKHCPVAKSIHPDIKLDVQFHY